MHCLVSVGNMMTPEVGWNNRINLFILAIYSSYNSCYNDRRGLPCTRFMWNSFSTIWPTKKSDGVIFVHFQVLSSSHDLPHSRDRSFSQIGHQQKPAHRWYGWWFRNSKQPLGIVLKPSQTPVNGGINRISYQPQLANAGFLNHQQYDYVSFTPIHDGLPNIHGEISETCTFFYRSFHRLVVFPYGSWLTESENGSMEPKYGLRFVSVIGPPLLISWEYDDWFLL